MCVLLKKTKKKSLISPWLINIVLGDHGEIIEMEKNHRGLRNINPETHGEFEIYRGCHKTLLNHTRR